MAWKNEKTTKVIIDILNDLKINYKLEEELSIIKFVINSSIGDIYFNLATAERFIVFMVFTFEHIKAYNLDKTYKLVNLNNNELDAFTPYIYISDDVCVCAKGEMYHGANPDIDSDFIDSLRTRILDSIINMLDFARAYKYIELGYDTETAFRMRKNTIDS